jgi:hypothetical protein
LWVSYLRYKSELAEKVLDLVAPWSVPDDSHPSSDELLGNLAYGAAICRVHYRRSPRPLPKAGDVQAMAEMWKVVYNTVHGKGKVEEFVRNYVRLVTPAIGG